jgi:predicted RNase H-like HicB family nuclease
MTCEILVRPSENGFTATVLGLPDCTVEAATREEAIQKARVEAQNLIAAGEIIRVEIGQTQPPQSFAGMWADDETFDDFVAAMKAYRQQVNSDPNQL